MTAAATSIRERPQGPDRVVVPVLCAVVLGILFNAIRAALVLDRAGVGPAIAAFAGLGAATTVLAWRSHLSGRALGLARPARLAATAGTALASVTLVLPSLLLHPHPLLHPGPTMILPLVVLYAGLVAPAEELLFRGVMFGGLQRMGGPTMAIVVTAVVFAVAHWPVYGPTILPLDFGAGLLLGWLRWWSRSLVPVIVTHAVADLALLVL